jgi:hypothetical protein
MDTEPDLTALAAAMVRQVRRGRRVIDMPDADVPEVDVTGADTSHLIGALLRIAATLANELDRRELGAGALVLHRMEHPQ